MTDVTIRPPPMITCANCATGMQELYFPGIIIPWCPECGCIYREAQDTWLVPKKTELILVGDPQTRKAT